MPEPGFPAVLAAVARLVAESPALDDVVGRLPVLLRDLIPFERLHVLRLDRMESVVLYSATTDGAIEVRRHRLAEPGAEVPDLDAGVQSRIICPVRQGARVDGAIWLTSTRPHAFTAEHQAIIDPVADLLTLALQTDVLRSTESLRRERLDSLDRLLRTIGESLDIRQVFSDVSEVVRAGLPHDLLALTAWGDDGRSLRLHALAGLEIDDPTMWSPMALTDHDLDVMHREAYVVHDVSTELEPASLRYRLCRRFGVHSLLRVPLPMGQDVFGSLFFLARDRNRFTPDDIDFAQRVGFHLALALSHQRLSDAARRDAESRETAERLEAQVATLRRELKSRGGSRRLVGHSPRWNDVLAQAARVAQTTTTVLLTGESGTGKEVVARFIHHGSARRTGPFVAINCAALPDQLLESELFGYERGAFTGAVAAKPGRIEQANGGVLFLDEVGEMAPAVQAKLLRVLEEREYQRLGGTRALRADIRVISATNRDLQDAIRRGEFREDLYYRLGVFEIALPPLRERPDDILELAETFLADIGESVGRPARGLGRDAQDQLLAYHWPGNVRELRNAIERAVILADGGWVRAEHLPGRLPAATAAAAGATAPLAGGDAEALPAGGVDLHAIERSLVVKALAQARHNKTRAARLLGLTRAQLYSRIEKYKLAETEP
jgi:transcriptional regulator with GAF, ATPase, and Fis domain